LQRHIGVGAEVIDIVAMIAERHPLRRIASPFLSRNRRYRRFQISVWR
jgi:hypothetical protein